jgi:hypothetical protein
MALGSSVVDDRVGRKTSTMKLVGDSFRCRVGTFFDRHEEQDGEVHIGAPHAASASDAGCRLRALGAMIWSLAGSNS